MNIVKEFEWMRSYISEIEHIVPAVKYLKRISIRKSHPNKQQLIVGMFTYYDKKHYRICLYRDYKDRNTGEIKKFNTIGNLHNLAHELAHFLTLLHTPERMKLECTIMSVFMTKLTQDGYISEEDEEKNGDFYLRNE